MRLRFDDCELDVAARTLRRGGRPVHVQPRVMDLLLYLVRHRHRAVPKDELLASVWADAAVSDGVIARAVREARRAIGDDGAAQAAIATLRRHGYRFAAAVTTDAATRRPPLAGRCDELLEAAERHRCAGDRAAADEACRAAGEAASAAGDADGIARAALARVASFVRCEAPDPRVRAVLVHALSSPSLPASAAGPRARILARLAAEHCMDDDPTEHNGLREHCLALAREADDAAVWVDVLRTPLAQLWDALPLHQRRAFTSRLVERSRRRGDVTTSMRARMLRLTELMASGDLELFDVELDALVAWAACPGDRYRLRLWRACRVIHDGDPVVAERCIDEAHEAGSALIELEALDLKLAQRAVLAARAGWAGDLLPRFETFEREHGGISTRCILAWLCAKVGDRELGDRVLARVLERDVPRLASLRTPAANAALVVSACAGSAPGTAAREAARQAYGLLAPFSGRLLMRQPIACHGPADGYLAQAAAIVGDHRAADRHARRAEALERLLGGQGAVRTARSRR